MRLWMSGEIQADVDSAYMKARNAIQYEVNRFLAAVSIPGKIDEWDFIAIIREEDSPDYTEVAKKSAQGKELEFRLKIRHAEFLAASPEERIGLIFKALSRSVDLMGQLGVSVETQNALRTVLFRAENQSETDGPVN